LTNKIRDNFYYDADYGWLQIKAAPKVNEINHGNYSLAMNIINLTTQKEN